MTGRLRREMIVLPPWFWVTALVLFVMAMLFLIGHKGYMKEKHPETGKSKPPAGGKKGKNGHQAAPKKDTGGTDRTRLKGYIPADRLPAGSKRLLEEEMTYREFLKKFPEFEGGVEIELQTRVLVLRTATKNSRGQTMLSTTVYKMPSGNLVLESVKTVKF